MSIELYAADRIQRKAVEFHALSVDTFHGMLAPHYCIVQDFIGHFYLTNLGNGSRINHDNPLPLFPSQSTRRGTFADTISPTQIMNSCYSLTQLCFLFPEIPSTSFSLLLVEPANNSHMLVHPQRFESTHNLIDNAFYLILAPNQRYIAKWSNETGTFSAVRDPNYNWVYPDDSLQFFPISNLLRYMRHTAQGT